MYDYLGIVPFWWDEDLQTTDDVSKFIERIYRFQTGENIQMGTTVTQQSTAVEEEVPEYKFCED